MGKQWSKSRRFAALVRMDVELCRKARILAEERGLSMAEMFNAVLKPWVEREWAKRGQEIKANETR